MKYRNWECSCGHQYTAEVVLSAHTPNLSGEATAWCPKCGRKPVSGSPWIEMSDRTPEGLILDPTSINNGD
jgi:hypothetical protein